MAYNVNLSFLTSNLPYKVPSLCKFHFTPSLTHHSPVRSHILLPRSCLYSTTSSKKERLESYLAVGDLKLSPEDVESIDKAGAKGALWDERKSMVKKVVGGGLAVAVVGQLLVKGARSVM